MPWRVILTITEKRIETPGPLTQEEAIVLARYHNENQLLSSWHYEIQKYDVPHSSKPSRINTVNINDGKINKDG